MYKLKLPGSQGKRSYGAEMTLKLFFSSIGPYVILKYIVIIYAVKSFIRVSHKSPNLYTYFSMQLV